MNIRENNMLTKKYQNYQNYHSFISDLVEKIKT